MVGLMRQNPQRREPVTMDGEFSEQPRRAPGGRQQEPSQEQQPNVTKEEQQAYNQFVANGMMLIYDEKSMPATLQMIQGDGNPIEGLGNALANVVMRIEDSAKDKGVEMDPDVMYHGASELLEQMVELAEQSGVAEFSEEQMESAFYYALDRYRTTRQQAGELHEEALQDDLADVLEAEEKGQLDEILPGVRQYAEQAPRPEDLQEMAGGEEGQAPRRGLMRR